MKMIKEYPTIVVLSNDINSDGTLKENVKSRTDAGIVLYSASLVDKLTMSGKCTALKDGKMEAHITHAEAMKRYAVERGVLEENILKDEKSITTVGQAYCVKREIIVPNNWDSFAVLTSDYHIARTKEIFNFIFGKDFNINYISVPSEHYKNQKEIKAEARRIKVFKDFWKKVKPGDDKNIREIMHTKFPFYKGKTWEEL